MAIERKDLLSFDPFNFNSGQGIERSFGPYQAAFSVYSIRLQPYPDEVRITTQLVGADLSFKAGSYGIDKTVSNKTNIIQPDSPWRLPADTKMRFFLNDQGGGADLYGHILVGIHTGTTVRA